MPFDLSGLARLWNDPPPESDADAYRAFAEVYADPVVLNGETVSVRDLVAMARQSHLTYQNQDRVILDVLDSGDKVAFAFVLRGAAGRQASGRPDYRHPHLDRRARRRGVGGAAADTGVAPTE